MICATCHYVWAEHTEEQARACMARIVRRLELLERERHAPTMRPWDGRLVRDSV